MAVASTASSEQPPEKDGYTKQVARIKAELDGWYMGNICIE